MGPRVPTARTNPVWTPGASAAESCTAQPGVHPPNEMTAATRFGRIRSAPLTDRRAGSAARARATAGSTRCLLPAEPAGVAERTAVGQPGLRGPRSSAAAACLHRQQPCTQLTDHAASLEAEGEVPEPAAQRAAGSTDPGRARFHQQLHQLLGGGAALRVAGPQALGPAIEVGRDHPPSARSRCPPVQNLDDHGLRQVRIGGGHRVENPSRADLMVLLWRPSQPG